MFDPVYCRGSGRVRQRFPSSRLAMAAGLLLSTTTWVTAIDLLKTSRTTYRGEVLRADAETVLIELESGNRIGVPRKSIIRSRVEPDPEVLKGIETFDQGDIPGAYGQLLKSVPRFYGVDADWVVNGAIRLGHAAIGLKKYEDAEKVFRTIEKLHPNHPLILGAYVGRARVRLEQEEYESAWKAFTELSKRFNNVLKPPAHQMEVVADLFLGTGKAAEGLARWEEALDAYLKVIALVPAEKTYEEALFRSAVIRAKLGENRSATAALDELREDFPGSDYHAQASKLHRQLEKQANAP